MAYQAIARKYRPIRFKDVVGQLGVTQTLSNAIAKDRVGQAFVFAGPRGVGKTTTARILARALNCEKGPVIDPCGVCDACKEISHGRDIDVLEIDAATHTQIDNIREVVIAGLAIPPVRDNYKIFIIDEVHQLSKHSFNALLKSIEEPPPHVVFMMATTELRKIPETILSRSQVFEFRAIGSQVIADQLLNVAEAEKISIDSDAVALIARSAEGSMRDAQSALDQVRAFSGDEINAESVSVVLGLIGRDPVFQAVKIVADEDAPAVFDLVGTFLEAGYNLHLVCKELIRVVRDMLVIVIDKTRIEDPEIAGDSERERLKELTSQFSREDLIRAFDVLTQTEREIAFSTQPRLHLEMALIKWIHLRKLVPLTDLLAGNTTATVSNPSAAQSVKSKPSEPKKNSSVRSVRSEVKKEKGSILSSKKSDDDVPSSQGDEKSTILREIKNVKKFFYGTVVAQAQRIDFKGDRLIFQFSSSQKTLESQLFQSRSWLEELVSNIVQRKVTIETARAQDTLAPSTGPVHGKGEKDIRTRAVDDQSVQAMLEVFSTEISEVEKIKP